MEQNMSNEVAEHEALLKKKRRKKRIRKTIILSVLALILIAGGFIAYKALSLNKEDDKAGVLRFRFQPVSEGEINTTISGSGTLAAKKTTTVSSAADGTVKEIYLHPGDSVKDGDAVLKLSSKTLEDQISSLYTSLQPIQSKMAGMTSDRTNLNITAPRAGIVKEITVSPKDSADSVNYLCRISTDGQMRVEIDSSTNIKKFANVTVSINGTNVSGYISDISDKKAYVVIEDNGYSVGTPVSVKSGTIELGSGKLECNENVVITQSTGCISEVKVEENQEVKKNAVLFTLEKGAMTDSYKKLYDQSEDLLQQIKEIEDCLLIKSDLNGIVASLSVEEGDDVTAGQELCIMTSNEGFVMTLGIDELDIASVAIGQDVTITLDAVEGEFKGKVTNLSYSGTGNYVTTYTATVTTDPIEGALPGMSGDAEVITSSSGKSLIVPVSAVQYEGDKTYVLLIPSGFDRQQEVTTTDVFTKIPVTTGMSDGSYIVISGEGLKADDTLCVPGMETTAVYNPSDNSMSSWMKAFSQNNRGSGMSGMSGNRPNGSNQQRPSGNWNGGPGGNFNGNRFGG